MQHTFLFNLPPFSPISAPLFPFSASGVGIVCGRLAAGRGLLQRLSWHRSPRGPSFCSCKRKQNRAKGNRAFPFANPFDAKLRLNTNDPKHRPYGAADTLSRCLRRIICGVTANRQRYHRKACASLSNEGNELKNFPHSRSVNVEDCGEYIAGFGFQCYRLTSFLSVRPSR